MLHPGPQFPLPGGSNGAYSVAGQVTDINGEPLTRATVIAFGLNLRSSHELGRAVTDESGAYTIPYANGNGKRDMAALHPTVDLQVELINPAGAVALTSPIAYNAEPHTTIDLALGGPQRTQPSEYSRLTSTIMPLLGNLAPTDLREDTQFRDLTFLEGQTSVARPHIALWSIASHLASSTQLPPQLFYALFRNNVPANAETIALASSTQGTDLATNAQLLQEALLSTTPATLEQTLKSALEIGRAHV